jgi:hypothetical protein
MPITNEVRKKIADKIKEITKQGFDLNDEAAKSFVDYIGKIRDDITKRITSAEGIDAIHLKGIKKDIEDILNEFKTKGTESLQKFQDTGYQLGSDLVTDPLKSAGVKVAIPGISKEQLIIMQNMSTDLISGASEEAKVKIKSALNQALLGELTPTEAALKVDSALAGLQDRGEAIVRTEVGRAFSIATQMRQEQYQKALPSLKKQWLTSIDGRERPSHAAINGQIKNIDEPFEVPNYRTGGTEEAMYPHDPNLSPENSVNCRCVILPITDEWASQEETV